MYHGYGEGHLNACPDGSMLDTDWFGSNPTRTARLRGPTPYELDKIGFTRETLKRRGLTVLIMAHVTRSKRGRNMEYGMCWHWYAFEASIEFMRLTTDEHVMEALFLIKAPFDCFGERPN